MNSLHKIETCSALLLKLVTRHQCNNRFYIEMNFSITLTTMPSQTCLELNGTDSEYSAVFKGMCTELPKLLNDERIPQNLYIIKINIESFSEEVNYPKPSVYTTKCSIVCIVLHIIKTITFYVYYLLHINMLKL